MNVSGLDVIARSTDFEAAATRLVLRPWQWHFLHAVDGRSPLRDVAANCGLELETAVGFAAESEALGLVRVVSMALDEYRTWCGMQPAIAEPPPFAVPTRDDHFSTSDTLAAYATTVPDWMIEAPAYGADSAEFHYDEPVAEFQHEEPVAEFQHEEPVAELHYGDPVAEFHQGSPAAEVEPEIVASSETDAAQAVTDLVGWHRDDEATASDEPNVSAPQPAERTPVSLSFGEPDPSAFSTNGYHPEPESEAASLVTTIDAEPTRAAHEASDEMAGISISLGAPAFTSADAEFADPEPTDYQPVAELQSEHGSVSFSLSPDHDDLSPTSHCEVAPVAHDPTPDADRDETPVAEYSAPPAAPQSTNGRIDNAAPSANGSSPTADIVGSLIARALTFRIK